MRFPAKVRMCLYADGKAVVQTPAAEIGMGTATVQIQHAADRLGLPLERVSFHYGDSKLADTLMAGLRPKRKNITGETRCQRLCQ